MTKTLRPRLHFTPEKNWMNDPNGLIWHDGIYHLFFQHNPHGDGHGNMSWGHATSRDLVAWEHQPIALMHDDIDDVFSGSVVWDEHDSSGLGADGHGPLVAIYTAARRAGDHQSQHIAFSADGGTTWARYAGNPVLDLDTDDFRDPKVFRYSDDRGAWWVMVAVEARSRRVILHRSDDLITWTYLSRYGPAGSVEGLWECPDLFPLAADGDPADTRWVMIVSVSAGSVAGGSGTQYVIGGFDGSTFTPDVPLPAISSPGPDHTALNWFDRGRDCYAGVTYNGRPDDDRIFLGWMSNWDYAQQFPSEPWRGSMTIPRRLSLHRAGDTVQLRQQPVIPKGRVTQQIQSEPITVARPLQVSDLPVAAAVDIELAVRAGDVAHLTLSGADGTSLRIAVDATTRRCDVDRTSAGAVHPAFPSRQTVTAPTANDALRLQLILDAASVEVFLGAGVTAVTNQVVMSHPWTLTVSAADGTPALASLSVTELIPHEQNT